MSYQELSKSVAEHAVLLFIQNQDERLYYHNLSRTAALVDAAKKINEYHQLNERDNFIVFTALWFHDTGILFNGLPAYQTKSAELAASFLKSIEADEQDIEAVKNSIVATLTPLEANSVTEKIVCDAQLMYLGGKPFKDDNRLLKKETEALGKAPVNNDEWRAQTIELLETHVYHTDYCQLILNKTKAENLDALKLKQDVKTQKENQMAKEIAEGVLAGNPVGSGDLTGPYVSQLKKNKHHLQGVQTMFKNSSSNHQRLSVMADNKAFIMISTNSIIISVAIGLYIGKFTQKPGMLWPTIFLMGISVVTIIYSVLATRPNIPPGTFTREQVEKKTVNLLFFGSFYNMELKDFEYGIREMMNDSEFLYGSLIKDIYWQGKILGRKFRLLRISYNVFMYGIAISVLAYLGAAFLFGN
jgi:predicted metal-dependent HD superfamily phosphohydrolase